MRLSYAGDGSEDEGGGDHGAGFATSSKSPPHFLALLRFNSVRFEWVQAAPANRIVVVGLSFSPEISAGVCTRVSSWACSLLVQIGVDSSITRARVSSLYAFAEGFGGFGLTFTRFACIF